MAEKKAREVEAYLSRRPAEHRLFLLYGPDRGLVSERASALAATSGLALDDPFAVARLDGESVEQNPGLIAEEALQVSMFGGDRLVWVRQVRNPARISGAVQQLLAENLSQVTIIIEAGELPKSSALRSVVEKSENGMALPCYADEARGLDDLIEQGLTAHGLRIDGDARRLLRSLLGGDRMASRSEIEKLALYGAGAGMITSDMVHAVVGDASATTIDGVIDAVLSGDVAAMDELLGKLGAGKISLEAVIAVLIRQFETIERLRGAMEIGNKSLSDAINSARPPIFFSRRKPFETCVGALDLPRIAAIQKRLETCQHRMRQMPTLSEEQAGLTLLGIAVEIRRGASARFVRS